MYNYNGENSKQLAKGHNFDGTTSKPLAKGYRYNGTTSHLIYNSQSPDSPTLLNDDNQVAAVTGGWTMRDIGGYAYCSAYYGPSDPKPGPTGWYMSFSGNNLDGKGWMTTNQPVEISGYSKISLTFFYQQGYGDANPGNGYVYIALTTSPEYAGGWYGSQGSMTGTNIVRSNVSYTSAYSGTATLECDISGVDGAYYVQIGRWNAAYAAVYTSAFKTVTLTE